MHSEHASDQSDNEVNTQTVDCSDFSHPDAIQVFSKNEVALVLMEEQLW